MRVGEGPERRERKEGKKERRKEEKEGTGHSTSVTVV
jgi:hypothetical protein